MKATEFIQRYRITTSVTHLHDTTLATDNDLLPRRRFEVTFDYIDTDGQRRSATFLHETGIDTTAAAVDPGEVLRLVANDAYYGESYEELVSDYGPNLHVSREQWEQDQHAIRLRCREWLTDQMWEDFPYLEPDDDGTPAEPVRTSGGVPLTDDVLDDLAAEAEQGYPIERLRERTHRPTTGDRPRP